jgi:cobalt/nickel transport system permease protein
VGAWLALGIGWLFIATLSTLARLGPLRPSRGAFFALPFVLAALPLVFTRAGEPLGTVSVGPMTLTISGEGLEAFATIAFKSWVSVQAALLLSLTTPFHDLIDALRELRLSRILVAIISFLYRYLDVLAGEASRMNRARTSRSAVVPGRRGGSLAWRASVTGNLVGSLFLRSYERSERIYGAMQARGFDGELRHLPGPRLGRGQVAWFALAMAILATFEVAAHTWWAA